MNKQVELQDLGNKEFAFDKINIANPQGLENFTFLEDWTNGITFIKEIEEEL